MGAGVTVSRIRCKQWWLCQPAARDFRVTVADPGLGQVLAAPAGPEISPDLAQGRERDEVHNVALGASLSSEVRRPCDLSLSRKSSLRTTTSPSELQPLPTLCFLLSCRPAVPQIRPLLQPPTHFLRASFLCDFAPLISLLNDNSSISLLLLCPPQHTPPLPPHVFFSTSLRHS